ncbi:MAG: single-stranded DNA-binding protein [Armatimonadetes bacterium]|nr:single-stranded DNA-binding protein [Armatimonadota bacterium]
MSSINRVIVTGRLTHDPELRTTPTGKQVVNFQIAVQKRMRPQNPDDPDADFFRVTAWNQSAEFIANYGHKGRMIGVDGRLQSRRYTGNDGLEREVVEIVASNLVLLDRPRDGEKAKPARTGEPEPVAAKPASEPEPDDYDPFAEE